MKLVTYRLQGQDRPAVLADTTLIDAGRALAWAGASAQGASDMVRLIQGQDETVPALRRALAAHLEGKLPSGIALPQSQAELVAPVPRPVSMRDGYAFRQHV